MPQSDRNSQRENKPRGNEPSFNWRGVILIAVAFGFFALAMLFWRGNYPQLEDVPYNRFLELLENKQIVNDKNAPLTLFVEEGQPTQQLRGKYIKQGAGGAQNMEVPFRTVIYLNFTSNLQDKLTAAGIQPSIRSESHPFGQALLSFGPVLFLLALLYFLFRQQIRMAGKGALNFGKSKARMLARDKNKITFKDVAEFLKFFRVAQKLDQFLDFVLSFLDAGDVLEGDFVFVTSEHARFRFAEVERAFASHADLLAEKKIEKCEQKQHWAEAQERLAERMRFGTDGRLNSGSGELVLQIAGEIEINDGAKRQLHVLRAAVALLDVFAAQLLGGLAFLDEQGKRRIFVVHDLLVLKQLEKAIVGNVFELRIVPAPEEHREGEKAESDRDQDDAAPIETRLVAAGLVLAVGATIGLLHKGCEY